MALSKKDEQLLELLLKEREQAIAGKQNKPFHIRALQFSMVFLSLLLFVTVGTFGVLILSKPQLANAANTYTESWTAADGIYTKNATSTSSGGTITYVQGLPTSGTVAGWGGSGNIGTAAYGMITVPANVTVTSWNVSGSIAP